MKALIIDDDPSSVQALTQKLAAYDDQVTLAGTACNGIQGISLVKQHQPDLLFLDVELPDISGLDFLSQMSSMTAHPCKVVVYTGHSAYMLPAFRSKAFDFLQKPIDDGELRKIILRAMTEREWSPAAPNGGPASQHGMQDKDNEKLLLYTNATDFRLVNISNVAYFQYNHEQRVWEVVVTGHDEPIRLKRNVTNDQLITLDSRFIQVSQRHIININYLMEVNDGVCRFYPPFNKIDHVKVGRTYRKNLTDRFSSL